MSKSAKYLLIEAGGTSTDWIFFNENEVVSRFKTAGINPETMRLERHLEGINREVRDAFPEANPERVWYYGAGMSSDHSRQMIHSWNQELFPRAKFEGNTDLVAAARAACGNEPGIVAILGTGSIACSWDGKQVIKRRGGHGWALGDEGSGADLGKSLLKRSLDYHLPKEIIEEFTAWAGKTPMELRSEVYQSATPATLLAGFAPFLKERLDNRILRNLVSRRLESFIDTTIFQLEGGPVYWVGSIAFHFREVLEEVAAFRRNIPGGFLKEPGEALVKYHQENPDV